MKKGRSEEDGDPAFDCHIYCVYRPWHPGLPVRGGVAGHLCRTGSSGVLGELCHHDYFRRHDRLKPAVGAADQPFRHGRRDGGQYGDDSAGAVRLFCFGQHAVAVPVCRPAWAGRRRD